ncbi:MAG: sugar phosphate isomerase/epimerase [Planctomycetes bacterium]|nr:sugar phosphate isomerase/epimerase [Planctomycetota bacterium]
MKLAVSTYSLSRWRQEQRKTLEESIDWIAKAGVQGVEFAGLDDQPPADPVKRAQALRAHCRNAGLEIPSYCVGGEFLVPPAEQRSVVEQVKRHVDVAAALGVRSMRHDVTRGPKDGDKRTVAQVLAVVAPAVREVSEYAKTLGVITSVENHGFYLQTAERVEALVKAVKLANFRVTLDMGNFLCLDQDPVAAVAKLAKYAVMVHAKDFHSRPKKRTPPTGWFATPKTIALRGAIVGHGVIDVPAQIKLLKRAKYDHFLSLEFEGIEEPTAGITLGLNYLRQLLGEKSSTATAAS